MILKFIYIYIRMFKLTAFVSKGQVPRSNSKTQKCYCTCEYL